MDKNTLSNYGWIVIAVLVLSVMIALATPFGAYIKSGVESTTQGLFDTSEKAMNVVGMSASDGSFAPKMLEGDGQILNKREPISLSFRSSAPVDTFKTVKVDGETVASQNYTVTEGSTIVTFTKQYAQTLADGSHSIEIVSDDGYGEKSATATFSVETPQLTTLTEKNWNGLTSFSGEYIWTDGTKMYYSKDSEQYVLNGDTWEPKSWNGLTVFKGRDIWTDGTNIYLSEKNVFTGVDKQYVLNGNTWVAKEWNGLTPFSHNIWTDGRNIYYSDGSEHYVLNGNTWETTTWNGTDYFYGEYIWTDGINLYSSMDGLSTHYILNGDTWNVHTWDGWTRITGNYIWTDGARIYYSNLHFQYVLNGNTWEAMTWDGLTSFDRHDIWTDGTNYYYSDGTNHYVFS